MNEKIICPFESERYSIKTIVIKLLCFVMGGLLLSFTLALSYPLVSDFVDDNVHKRANIEITNFNVEKSPRGGPGLPEDNPFHGYYLCNVKFNITNDENSKYVAIIKNITYYVYNNEENVYDRRYITYEPQISQKVKVLLPGITSYSTETLHFSEYFKSGTYYVVCYVEYEDDLGKLKPIMEEGTFQI